MTSRERIKTIIAGKTADRCGFWLGLPHDDTWPIYLEHFGLTEREELHRYLHDDIRWICAEWGCYKNAPNGPGMFHTRKKVGSTENSVPVFAECQDVAEVEACRWPDPDYLDFSSCLESLRGASDVYRASGMWASFFHVVADYFGMENYFIKMYTHPDVVYAVTRHVCDFYYEANERFFRQAGDLVDATFFGNDLGTQLDLFVSPEMFDRFIYPDLKRFAEQGCRHGLQVMMHSCGAVHKVIDRYIDAGIMALHPLQAKAQDMDADSLARDFKGRIAFVGGIDTQELLMNGTPQEVRAEVRRVKDILGPNVVISPSHEALLPNIPPENVLAMAEEAITG